MVQATLTLEKTNADRFVQIWLVSVAFLVLCMIIVGGATRLTDHSAAERGSLAGGVREVPADPRISTRQQGDVA